MVKFRKIFFDPDSYSDQSYSEKLRTQGRVSSVRASRYYYWDMMNEKPSGVCGNWPELMPSPVIFMMVPSVKLC